MYDLHADAVLQNAQLFCGIIQNILTFACTAVIQAKRDAQDGEPCA